MFIACEYLTELNLSSFDTRNVTNMGYMFYTCYKLNTLNLSNFDTQNVTDMSSMFYDCNSLTAIYVGDKFVTTACGASEQMFSGCKKLVGAVPYDASKTDKEMANYTTGYFTDIKATGIDATPASGNIAAKYYDMQGRRMDAPQKGLNIVKRSDRTMKVLVK
uniref:BspA family leucine-rich repeat surface protein n=1 Tax=Prevotella sp. TaxID=59823 RepID=UPI003FF0A48F